MNGRIIPFKSTRTNTQSGQRAVGSTTTVTLHPTVERRLIDAAELLVSSPPELRTELVETVHAFATLQKLTMGRAIIQSLLDKTGA